MKSPIFTWLVWSSVMVFLESFVEGDFADVASNAYWLAAGMFAYWLHHGKEAT